jgi:imidazolonepropionase-like amidohydrolase
VTTTRLRNAVIFAGTDEQLVGKHDVVIENHRIAQITPAASDQAGRVQADREFELDGHWLIPGLINLHDHLELHGVVGTFEHVVQASPELCTVTAYRNALAALATGITTIRDLGARSRAVFEIRDAVSSGSLVGPRIYAAGRPIAMTGGHAPGLAIEADGPAGVLHATRLQLKAGADVIKIFASGGISAARGEDPYSAQLTLPEMRSIVDEAHRAGRRVAAHAHPPQAIGMSLEAEVDTIEHAAFMDSESARLTANCGACLIPTMVETWAVANYGQLLERPAWSIEACKQTLSARFDAVRHAIDAGVMLATGTDLLGSVGKEVQLLTEAGLSPSDALLAATRNGAIALGLADSLGTIEVGKIADMVVLSADPVADVRALLTNVEYVISDGKVFRPDDLRAPLRGPDLAYEIPGGQS